MRPIKGCGQRHGDAAQRGRAKIKTVEAPQKGQRRRTHAQKHKRACANAAARPRFRLWVGMQKQHEKHNRPDEQTVIFGAHRRARRQPGPQHMNRGAPFQPRPQPPQRQQQEEGNPHVRSNHACVGNQVWVQRGQPEREQRAPNAKEPPPPEEDDGHSKQPQHNDGHARTHQQAWCVVARIPEENVREGETVARFPACVSQRQVDARVARQRQRCQQPHQRRVCGGKAKVARLEVAVAGGEMILLVKRCRFARRCRQRHDSERCQQ